MWPRLKLREELTKRGRFYCDPENPFARFGGGGTDVEQAPTHTQSWGQLEQALAGLAVPGIGGMEMAQPEYYGGERQAEMSSDAMLAAQNALSGMAGGSMQFYDPIYQRATQQWNQEIAPNVMERFAGMGNALSGGASSALAREGQNLMTGISAEVAPLYQKAIFEGLPGLATWEQQGRQQPLDVDYQKWFEQQPYASPYVAMGKDIMSGGGANAMENYAEPGTDWGSIGGSLGAAAIMKSDRRWKQNFADISGALVKLKKFRGQTYNFKNVPDERRAGLIAQDVQAVLPEAVEERADGLYLRFDGVLALLVNAVNELAEQVAALN